MSMGSFKIQAMTFPVGEWIWSLTDAKGSQVLSQSGYRSAEEAGTFICAMLEAVGADPSNMEIWIERKVRSRFQCPK